jgi:hypothetical protein
LRELQGALGTVGGMIFQGFTGSALAAGVFLATTALASGGAPKEEGGAAEAREAARLDTILLPSGIEAQLQEVRREGAGQLRARYVAEGFRRDADLEEIAADMDYLCAAHVLPELTPAEGAQVIVSLAEAPSEFGVANPEIAQVFEAYTIENGRCIWEAF